VSEVSPTWDQLRANRWMVVDCATQQLGVYPTSEGTVAVVFQPQGAQSPGVFTVCPEEIPLLCEQLRCAQGVAELQREVNAEAASAQAAFDLLTRVREAAK